MLARGGRVGFHPIAERPSSPFVLSMTSARPPRLILRSALAMLLLLVPACVTRQLEPDFSAFSTAYARDMNWQMLLNLARLDQGHPAYFMALGELRIPRTHSAR